MGSEGLQEPEYRLLRQFPRVGLSALKTFESKEEVIYLGWADFSKIIKNEVIIFNLLFNQFTFKS